MKYSHIEAIASRLTPQEKVLLKEIYEPTEVAVAPDNAWRSMAVSPAGEIRIYGTDDHHAWDDAGRRYYLRSRDAGMSWKKIIEENNHAMGQCTYSDFTGTYMTLITTNGANEGWALGLEGREPGVYALRSKTGWDDDKYTAHFVTNIHVQGLRLPITLSDGGWICTGQTHPADGTMHPVVMTSHDDGLTWNVAVLKHAPKHEVTGYHKGIRWQNYSCEPTVCELGDGRLMLLARTSQDYHYVYYSDDCGLTWTDPAPSTLHATITQPTLRRLSDGRIVLCWCNTQPLPELDQKSVWPPLNEGEISGTGDDVFTNRDANHMAISEDDGRTWIGMREMGLNVIRNDADFRSRGGNDGSLDKSIHQFESLELPYNKILVVYGQHTASRRVIIADLDWLYETSRTEDFRLGFHSLSTQTYLKSVTGNFRGFSGHCAWNRTNGAVMVPDPEGNYEEALLIGRTDDPRLFSDVQGATWNFPAAHTGRVKVRLRIDGDGIRLSLTDRWFNPIDETVSTDTQVGFVLKKADLPEGVWSDAEIYWQDETATLSVNGNKVAEMPFRQAAPNGFCYLHMQSTAPALDMKGALIKRLEKD